MDAVIKPGEMLTVDDERLVRAALELEGKDQKSLAEEEHVSYSRLNRVISRKEVPSIRYATLLSGIVRTSFSKLNRRLAA